MLTTTSKDRSEYIKDLELGSPIPLTPRSQEAALAADSGGVQDEEEAFVDAGSVVSFAGSLSGQLKDDVLNSVLLAQLVANKKHDRLSEFRAWYNAYAEVLENIGWALSGWNFRREVGKGTKIELAKSALAIIAALGTGGGVPILAVALDALRSLDQNDPQLTVFEGSSSLGAAGSFQLAEVSISENGTVVMPMGMFYFLSTVERRKFLFFSWEVKELNFFVSSQTMVLTQDIYADVRGKISDKLAEARNSFVKKIQL